MSIKKAPSTVWHQNEEKKMVIKTKVGEMLLMMVGELNEEKCCVHKM